MSAGELAPGRGSADRADSVLKQAWLEEQAALYQAQCEQPNRPSPVEFAARAPLPENVALQGFDLRARLIRRLRVLDGLRQALGSREGEDGADFQPGEVFQDLEILGPIGKGGMGRVYRARQISLGRVVALKAPHWAASLDPRERARFWREAQAIARLRHPGIVPLFAVGQRGGTPFLVLELVDGRPLSEVIHRLRTGALPRTGASLGRDGVGFELAAAGLAIEILSALQAAHEAGIVHRDVKPGNVMLESSGRVRVLDFGLAKMQRDEEVTRSREFLGTIQFTAPEVLDDPRNAGPASDIYSVGVLLYELLSLELPFGELSMHALVQRILADEPQPLHERSRVSRTFSAIVSKTMARDPASRYRSAREFADDLEAFIRGRTVSARPATFLDRLPRLVRRQLTPFALVLFVIGLTTLALVARSVDQARAVHADLVPADLRNALTNALLWDGEAARTGGSEGLDDGSERALERLEAAARVDRSVLYPRVHLHLAVLAAERGDRGSAERHLVEIESAGWDYETMRWIRDGLASGDAAVPLVRPPTGRELESLATDVDRYYFVRSRARAPEGRAEFPDVTALERHPVYAAPVRFLAAQRRARSEPPDLEGAIEECRAVLALAPEHPAVVATLLRWSCDYVRDQGWDGGRSVDYLAPLARLGEDTSARQTVHAAFRDAYRSLLDRLEESTAARVTAR